jgi:hypothetical protein
MQIVEHVFQIWSAEAIASAFVFARSRAEAPESESGGDASALQMAPYIPLGYVSAGSPSCTVANRSSGSTARVSSKWIMASNCRGSSAWK